MRGRKPKPTQLRILAGNPGHRALNDEEPAPPDGLPECPPFLDDEARAEWSRICPVLERMGVLSIADRNALSSYCVVYSRWVAAERAVKQYGAIVKSPVKGVPIKSPHLCVADKALEQMLKLQVEFGLTPSARSRIRLGDALAGSRLDQFLQRGRRRA